MKYAKQAQTALNKLDVSLAKLRTLIKRGETKAAIQFMEQGALKDAFEDLQNIITVSGEIRSLPSTIIWFTVSAFKLLTDKINIQKGIRINFNLYINEFNQFF